MFLASKELAAFMTVDQGVSIRYDSGPVEPLPICFAHKREYACMTAANPRVNVLKNNTSFVWQHAPHQSAVGTSPEEFIINQSVMPCLMTQ
jgi:hypothetical protein